MRGCTAPFSPRVRFPYTYTNKGGKKGRKGLRRESDVSVMHGWGGWGLFRHLHPAAPPAFP